MFEVIFDDKAIDFLTKLPKELRKRIYNKVISTKENPFRYFEKLKEIDGYKLRVGEYRVIADIDDKIITVLKVGHRKNIYDK